MIDWNLILTLKNVNIEERTSYPSSILNELIGLTFWGQFNLGLDLFGRSHGAHENTNRYHHY